MINLVACLPNCSQTVTLRLKSTCQKKLLMPNWTPSCRFHRCQEAWRSRLLGEVSPGNIIGTLDLMFYILTFERTVSEGGLLENCLQADYFSILEGQSNSYEFLTWHKGTPGHTAFHPNCIPGQLKALSLAICLVMQLRLVILIP